MRHIQVKIFKFSELKPDSQQRAMDKHYSIEGYHGSRDALNSLKALVKAFGGKLGNYLISWSNEQPSYCKFNMPTLSRHEIMKILDTLGTYDSKTYKGLGDCKLTGWDYDETLLDPIREKVYTDSGVNLTDLMQRGFRNLIATCQEDCDGFYTPEQFGEYSDENDYEYYEDGDIVSLKDKPRTETTVKE